MRIQEKWQKLGEQEETPEWNCRRSLQDLGLKYNVLTYIVTEEKCKIYNDSQLNMFPIFIYNNYTIVCSLLHTEVHR